MNETVKRNRKGKRKKCYFGRGPKVKSKSKASEISLFFCQARKGRKMRIASHRIALHCIDEDESLG